MYDEDELVRRLRICPDYNEGCVRCPHEHDLECRSTTMREAAEVIEKLQADKSALNDTVTNLLEQIKDIGKPRWIPVKEQLPEEDGHYLVYIFCEADEQLRGWTQIAWFRRKFYWEHSGEWYREVITHWMPLPQKPKGE